MPRNATTMIILLAVLATATPVTALEIPLQYHPYPQDREGFLPFGSASQKQTFAPPPGEWTLPKFVSDPPVYALVELGDRKHLMVLDRRNKATKFFDRLYFDANANRDLTDDPVIDGQANAGGNFLSASFPALDAEIVVDGATLPYSFMISAHCFLVDPTKDPTEGMNGQNLYVRLMANCAYRGRIDTGGSRYPFWLSDANGNGRFDNLCSPAPNSSPDDTQYPQGDALYIGAGQELTYYDSLALGDHLVIKDQAFTVKIDTAAGKLILMPVEEKLVSLQLAAEPERIVLMAKDDGPRVMAYRPGNSLHVPNGEYKLVGYQVFKSDDAGGRWRLNALATGRTPLVSAGENASSVLSFGEPYEPILQVPPETVREAQGELSGGLTFTVLGSAQETLIDLTRVSGTRSPITVSPRNPSRPKEPVYKVADSEGEIVAQGQFEYG